MTPVFTCHLWSTEVSSPEFPGNPLYYFLPVILHQAHQGADVRLFSEFPAATEELFIDLLVALAMGAEIVAPIAARQRTAGP